MAATTSEPHDGGTSEANRANHPFVGRRNELAQLTDADLAMTFQRRILEHDSYDESAFVEMIRLLVGASRHGEALRYADMYELNMREIGVEVNGRLAVDDARSAQG